MEFVLGLITIVSFFLTIFSMRQTSRYKQADDRLRQDMDHQRDVFLTHLQSVFGSLHNMVQESKRTDATVPEVQVLARNIRHQVGIIAQSLDPDVAERWRSGDLLASLAAQARAGFLSDQPDGAEADAPEPEPA